MKIVILDAYSVLYNDLSFDFLEGHEVISYDFTDKNDIIKNIGDAQIVFTNKCEITKEVVDACPNIKYIVEEIAGLLGISKEKVIETTFNNAVKLYELEDKAYVKLC